MEMIKPVAIGIGFIAVCWLAGYFVGGHFYSQSTPEPTIYADDDYCIAAEIDENGRMIYDEKYAEETDITVLETSNGPVLMAKCK